MTKRTRTFLFFACSIAFLIVTPTVLLYNQGYRLDLSTAQITKTGAFYFGVSPRGSDVFINGQLKKRTDFFFGSALIEELLPGNYLVEIKKEGYFPWKKNLEVKAMAVTEENDVVLFPEKTDFQIFAKGVERFFPSPSGKKALLQKKDSQGQYLTLFDFLGQNNVEKVFVREKDLYKKNGTVFFLDLQWSTDSQKILMRYAINEQEKIFWADTQQNPASPVALDFLKDFEKVDFSPDSPNGRKFLGLKEQTLFSGDLDSKRTTEILNHVLAFGSLEGKIYLLENSGFVFRIDNLAAAEKQKLNDVPLAIKDEVSYGLELSPSGLFLREADSLFFLDEKTKSFVEISESIRDFKISPDEEKLAYFNNSEISIYFLKERVGQPQKKAGDRILLARFSQKISQLYWLNNDYLIFVVGDKIKISEIDDRDQPNVVEIAELRNPQIFFKKDNKKASVLTEGNFLLSANLLP
ncbi:MAG: hypothetical protein A2117_00340 [Candidatus Wildermuthbacteria bacterium GWA2_46_15]|uniref:PEGA domain-containing protein n=1 Tax=Candidatus Wildermuthbacteria bacterium GWA2_46_15 TaxID=1802443 RepID=A0A1G2QNL4_9BACT|nr:MAG: hypothetical protein A2117_00340 [Candidatus Wildermuthbacteria bacterium GWA2_46_15]